MKYIVGNQKTYLNFEDAKKFVTTSFPKNDKVVMVLCPSMPYLSMFLGKDFLVGSQNVAFQDITATTGEVTASQLKSMNISYAIVGHSERRAYQKEDNETLAKKVSLLLENEIVPILCVGETKEERDQGIEMQIVKEELDSVFRMQTPEKIKHIMIAYEPIWSIGTGLVPSKEDIDTMMSYIKEIGHNYQSEVVVLYGGSVNAKNIHELNQIPSVDGYLVGGASTKIDEWTQMLNTIIEEER